MYAPDNRYWIWFYTCVNMKGYFVVLYGVGRKDIQHLIGTPCKHYKLVFQKRGRFN